MLDESGTFIYKGITKGNRKGNQMANLIENGEQLVLTDAQRDYLLSLNLIYDSGDDYYQITSDEDMEFIENQLMAAGLVG